MTGLAAFQDALARAVTGRSLSPADAARLGGNARSTGLSLTAEIRRSWCESRAAKAAHLTLSALPPAERRALVAAWIKVGGGTHPLIHTEADAFLAFIAPRLPDPSHALSLCRLERAVNAALAKSWRFAAPDPDEIRPETNLRRAEGAAMVALHAPMEMLVAALDGHRPMPPVEPACRFLLVAPGIRTLSRHATAEEHELWTEAAGPLSAGGRLEAARVLFMEGALVRDPS